MGTWGDLSLLPKETKLFSEHLQHKKTTSYNHYAATRRGEGAGWESRLNLPAMHQIDLAGGKCQEKLERD